MSTSLLLALLTTAQLLCLLAFQLIVFGALGIGPASDAFVAAQAVPGVLAGILTLSLQSAWQPRLAVAAADPAAWRAALQTAQAQALMAFAIGGAALLATAKLWLPGLFAGLAPPVRSWVLEMLPPLLLACVLDGGAAMMASAQRGRDRLLSAEVAALVSTMAAAFLAWPAVHTWGVVATSYLLLGRSLLIWLALQFLVGGSSPGWRSGWRDRATWQRLRPMLLASSVYKTAPLVDRFWSAMGPPGSATLLSLAQSGIGALASIFERSICMPVGPGLARKIHAGDGPGALRLANHAVLRVALATAAAAILLMALRPWWAEALGGGLGLTRDQAGTLWILCILLLGFLFVAAAGTAIVPIFYTVGDMRTPALVGLVGFCVGVVAKSAGFLWSGLEGLVLATSVYYLANLVALVVLARRRVRQLPAASSST